MAFLAVDNPVMRAELRHQRQVIQGSRSGWFWVVVALLMIVPAFITTVVLLVAALLGIHLEPAFAAPPLNILAQLGLTSLLIMQFALYIVVTLVTLALAAASISREQSAHTWESLLLTNMSARQIIRGKWWATLRALWGDHVMVLILRLGFVAYLDILSSYPNLPQPPRLLTGLFMVTAITIADSALTTILGILPPVSGRNPIVMTVAMGVRLVVSLIVQIVTFTIGVLVHEWNLLLVGAAVAGMSLYVLLTWGMLRFAEWAAVRNLVSPVPKAG